MITCFIRYQIDPFRTDAFEQYARGWNDTIPRCGARLTGYYAPHEGSATTAYGIYDIADLAAYNVASPVTTVVRVATFNEEFFVSFLGTIISEPANILG